MYSQNNQFPQQNPPHRIRLANGLTKTDFSTFTPEELEYAGWREVSNPPEHDAVRQRVVWSIDDGVGNWKLKDITPQEKWAEVRTRRNELINAFQWRVQRNAREQFLGLRQSDKDIELHLYMQALADITKQEDPFNIIWPEYGINNMVD